jgi:methanogenic corrinoid protein MtbC1
VILWCSYCLKYLGESAPFSDYSISHGICPRCLADVRENTGRPSLEKIRELNSRFQLMDITNGAELDELIEEGSAIGMSAQDLMIGLIQPALYNAGEKWSNNELSVADEHRITATASTIIERLFQKFPNDNFRQASNPTVLLLCAEGNHHILGVRMLEFILVSAQVPCVTIYPGLPNRESKTLIASLRPPFVGISIALEEQLQSVNELAEMLREDSTTSGTRIVVGGMVGPVGLEPTTNGL